MPTEESMPKQGGNTTKEVDLLNHYADEGIKLLRIHPETKNPIGNDWQNRRESLGVIEAHAKQGKPVGWQVGEVSGWISAVDCDWPETVRLAPRFLPETLTIHKGHEKPSLWIYRSEGLGFAGFRCPDASEVLCIKASNNGKGHQVVVPPSKHAVKGAYEFTEGGWNPAAITTVEAGELQRRCRMLATAALISRRLPDNGTPEKNGRHAISLAYAGFMLRNGESPEDVTRVLVAAWGDHSAPRGAIDSLRRNVADTARKIAADEPTTGGRTLEELLPGVPEKIAKFLDGSKQSYAKGGVTTCGPTSGTQRGSSMSAAVRLCGAGCVGRGWFGMVRVGSGMTVSTSSAWLTV